jgi:hypothetical protein
MYLQKGISIKTEGKKLIFVGFMKVTDKKAGEPYPLVKGTDPRSAYGSVPNATDPEHCFSRCLGAVLHWHILYNIHVDYT